MYGFQDYKNNHTLFRQENYRLSVVDKYMNDKRIRKNFHVKMLRKHHADHDTIIVDELGLKHGKCRADIAVINKHLIGYEIKSDEDSLYRFDQQIEIYNTVFDRATVIVGTKYADEVKSHVPDWWGIIASYQGYENEIAFETVRPARMNRGIDLLSVAQLLWRNEAISILSDFGVSKTNLQKKRLFLYQHLIELISPVELRRIVRDCLKKRRNWRCHKLPFPSGDLSQPSAK
jgi:hypothetical protein